jgi:hypothetical protein
MQGNTVFSSLLKFYLNIGHIDFERQQRKLQELIMNGVSLLPLFHRATMLI